MTVLSGLLALIILVLIVVNYQQGIWGNTLRLICVLMSALLATNFFEPVGAMIQGAAPSLWHYADFAAVWIVFGVVLFSLTYAMMKLSPTNVRFKKWQDDVGGVVLAAGCGWVLVCFACMTLHVAPIPREAFGGSFKAEQPSFFGWYPDRIWLGFVQQSSRGIYGRGNEFDPQGDFLLRTVVKRQLFETGESNFEPRPKTGVGAAKK